MALSSTLRLRRTLSLSSILSRCSTAATNTTSSRVSSLLRHSISPSPPPITNNAASAPLPTQIRSRSFHSTSLLLLASRSFNNNKDDVIDENTILFEGCDYKHWLITMDFPKDPKPSPEEMVETYVQTLAKVVGSVEEAKKRMYACSTTTYTGFQAEMDEETANKFEGMPGVVFVLPDSYIDPVNKEYGGDKYINGTIIPRPPPIQYGRPRRNRDQSQRGQMQNQRWGSSYDRQGSMQADARSYAPQQGPPHQQNYGPQQVFPSQQNYGPPQNFSQQHNFPPQQNYGPPQNFPLPRNFGQPQNYPSQQNYASPIREERSSPMSTYNSDFPTGGRDAFQGAPYRSNYGQEHNFSQEQRGYPVGNQRNYAPSQGGFAENNQSYAPPSPSGGSYGQGGPGSFGHNQAGPYGLRPVGGNYGHGPSSGYGSGYVNRGENPNLDVPPAGQDNSGQRDERNFQPRGQMGMDQGRY